MTSIAPPPVWIFPAAFAGWVLLLRLTRLDRWADEVPGRVAAVDGLRGILALMVFGHHFAIARQFGVTGEWASVASSTWLLFGQVGVAIFFMITGLLFTRKILRSPQGIRPLEFLVGRLFRLYPVYLVVVLVLAVTGLSLQGWPHWKAAFSYLHNLRDWLTFGGGQLLGWNDAGRAMALVAWTLQYEWIFYLLLPVAAYVWALTGLRAWPLLLVAAAALYLAHSPRIIPYLKLTTMFFAPFLTGACMALIPREGRISAWLRGWAGMLLSLIAVAVMFGAGRTGPVLWFYLGLVPIFAPIACGNTMGGLLTWRPFQFLGAISYDIYLLHGLVIFFGFDLLFRGALSTEDPLTTFGYLFATGLALIVCSLVMHRVVELPGQKLGQQAIERWRRRRGMRTARAGQGLPSPRPDDDRRRPLASAGGGV